MEINKNTNRIIQIFAVNVFFLFALLSALIVYFYYYNDDSSYSFTAEEQDYIKKYDGKIRIGADPLFAPVDYIEDGVQRGLAEDVFRAVEQKTGILFIRVNPANWADLLSQAKNGKIDIVKCATWTPERNQYLTFTKSYFDLPAIIVIRNDTPDNKTIKDLRGKIVAMTKDYSYYEYLMREEPKIKMIGTTGDLEALRLVSYGTVDAAISSMPIATYYIEKEKLTGLKFGGETGYVYKLGIASRKDDPILASILNKSVLSMNKTEINKITNKWIKFEYNKIWNNRSFWIFMFLMTSVISMVIVFVVLWNKSLRYQVKVRTRELSGYKVHLEEMVEQRTAELTKINAELAAKNIELNKALSQVRTLGGMIPICSICKKIRDDHGYWEQIEEFIRNNSDAEFSHGICPECARKNYGSMLPESDLDD